MTVHKKKKKRRRPKPKRWTRKRKIGECEISGGWYEIFADPTDTMGCFSVVQPGQPKGFVEIGLDWRSRWRVRNIMLHEIGEAVMVSMGLAREPVLGRDSGTSDSREFRFTHAGWNECAARIANSCDYIWPRLLTAWKEYRKEQKRGD